MVGGGMLHTVTSTHRSGAHRIHTTYSAPWLSAQLAWHFHTLPPLYRLPSTPRLDTPLHIGDPNTCSSQDTACQPSEGKQTAWNNRRERVRLQKQMKNKKLNQIKNNKHKLICHFWKCGWKSYLVLVSSWQILIWFIPLCGVNFHQEEDEAAWEDAAISGLGRGESNGEGKEEKARFATTYLSAFFIIGWKVKTEVTSDSLYLSQIFFFPSLAPGPNSQPPLQILLASPPPAVYILFIGSHVLPISNLTDRQTIADSRKLDHCDIRVMCRVKQPK